MFPGHTNDEQKQSQVYKALCNIQEIYEIGNADILNGCAIFIAATLVTSPAPELLADHFVEGLKDIIAKAIELKETENNGTKN